ncbi:MAG: hypothetical protein KF724_10430 [Phycisphaeraceae bacterium]|nr:hypothetical protein [Phycisphaeraceae bacterium]
MKIESRDPYDALAAIFLGPRSASSAAPPAPELRSQRSPGSEPRESIHSRSPGNEGREAVTSRAGRLTLRSASISVPDASCVSLIRATAAITGHLPVMAGLWATQFGDRVGMAEGPTGLIRCERDLVHAEILRGGGRQIGLHQGECLDEWLTRAARVIRRWIICVSGTSAPDEALHDGFAERVLLTSADEAAVAAARRVIDAVSERATEHGMAASLGVVVVGAPPERVQWMMDELGGGASGVIDLPLVGAIPRLDRVDSSERHCFEVASAPEAGHLLSVLESAASRAVDRFHDEAMVTERRPPRSMAPRPVAEPPPVVHHDAPTPRIVTLDEEPPSSSGPLPFEDGSTDVEAAREMPIEVGPGLEATTLTQGAAAPEAPASETGDASPSDLARLLTTVEALDFRCPVEPAIELASDQQGRLHLVAPVEAMTSLRSARRWATTNAALLVRAFPGLTCSAGVAPPPESWIIERVVTREASGVEGLHGCGVALDLLVSIPGSASAVHVPLNALAKGGASPASRA